MEVPIRLDPIFKKKQVPKEPPKALGKDVLIKYKKLINEHITFRIRILIPIGIVLHVGFNFLDRVVYPDRALLFLAIRVIDSIIIMSVFVLTFFKAVRNHIIWFADAVIVIVTGGMCLMIYLTDGASSNYYEGINLTILALPIVNSFYVWHNMGTCLVFALLYFAAVLPNQAAWNFTNFYSANFFMGSTAFLVVLLTKFYSAQHFNAFIRNEELKESERKLEILYGLAEEKSKIDDLTKIYNRRYFFEILAEKIRTCIAQGSFFYLIIFDIDCFKEINDTYGHAFGDQVISTVAQTVCHAIRPNSFIGRYGGDEFMIVIDKATREEFLRRTQMISNAIKTIPFSCGDKEVRLSASFGAARFDPDRVSSETKLIELADQALLAVKRTKRGEIKLAE